MFGQAVGETEAKEIVPASRDSLSLSNKQVPEAGSTALKTSWRLGLGLARTKEGLKSKWREIKESSWRRRDLELMSPRA